MFPDQQLYEETIAKLLRTSLQIIDGMNRHQLLIALGWDNSKTSTERLRKKARLAYIGNSPSFDLWAGYHG